VPGSTFDLIVFIGVLHLLHATERPVLCALIGTLASAVPHWAGGVEASALLLGAGACVGAGMLVDAPGLL
jgi:hypothetical protein